MRSLLSAFACASCAAASTMHSFRDTSPFLFFSTAEILASPLQISSAESLTSIIENELVKCPTDVYVLAHQPGVTASDYTSESSATFSGLQRYFSGEDKRVRSSLSVSQVIGNMDQAHLRELLKTNCGAGTMHLDARFGLADLADEARPRIITVAMNKIPAAGNRRARAHVNELYLHTMLDMLPTSNFTVIYTTTPLGQEDGESADIAAALIEEEEGLQYEMDAGNGYVHMELRRGFDTGYVARDRKNGTKDSDLPLFEKYQYFTPALFMGFSVGLLLLSILYVAIRAVAGMEVSYAAFEKENGPQSQQKKQ